MFLYEKIQIFSRTTGKPTGYNYIQNGKILCDYSGEVLDPNEHWNSGYPLTSYTVSEDGGAEPQFDAYSPFVVDDVTIDLYELTNVQHKFHFKQDWDNDVFNEPAMLHEAISRFDPPNNMGPPLRMGHTIGDLMWRSRLRVIRHLLTTKQYTMEQLGLNND